MYCIWYVGIGERGEGEGNICNNELSWAGLGEESGMGILYLYIYFMHNFICWFG